MNKTVDGFIRDNNNPGAALNTDNDALKAYKLKKQKDKEIEILKSDVSEIKHMLSAILQKLG